MESSSRGFYLNFPTAEPEGNEKMSEPLITV